MNTKVHLLTDDNIIERINQNGQEHLFGVLYSRYYNQVFFQAMKILKDKEAARDMTQDVMLKVFQKLDQYKGNASFGGWLRTITYNACIDSIRRNSRIFWETYDDVLLEVPQDNSEIERKIELEQHAETVADVIQELREKDQKVLRMRYYEGRSIREISHAINSGESATKMRLKRAKSRLKQQVQHQKPASVAVA